MSRCEQSTGQPVPTTLPALAFFIILLFVTFGRCRDCSFMFRSPMNRQQGLHLLALGQVVLRQKQRLIGYSPEPKQLIKGVFPPI